MLHSAARVNTAEAGMCLLALLRGGDELRSEVGAYLLGEAIISLIGANR